MRNKDDEKRQALINATVKLVNQVGFASSSVAKIAREAGVSASTLYIYFKNKEDLLGSTFVDIKLEIGEEVLLNFDEGNPVRDIFYNFCKSFFEYMSSHRDRAAYIEQFATSPYLSQVDHGEIDEVYAPFLGVIQRAKKDKIIKDVPLEYIALFMFAPISRLAVSFEGCMGEKYDSNSMNIVFDMAWDAIKR